MFKRNWCRKHDEGKVGYYDANFRRFGSRIRDIANKLWDGAQDGVVCLSCIVVELMEQDKKREEAKEVADRVARWVETLPESWKK